MIVGTAGHIDHGKTTLVRALTGVETDRLPEEKARGISIELGYAYVPAPDGQTLGFIDVPGHERFVHTMLAGASGIDLGLLVVAADDGVMPQTLEHLAILGLLGIPRLVVALTKADRVDPERLQAVQQQVMSLLLASPFAATFAAAPILPVSAPTGSGVDALRAALLAPAPDQATPVGADRHQQGFRLAVDRSFVLAGLGTVVTGTVFSGTVQVGDTLTIAPQGLSVRVRSLHAQNAVATVAGVGSRCALQVVGVQKDQVNRGDWLVAPAAACRTQRFDARLHLLPGEARALRHWTPVHLHLGAHHAMARVALLQDEGLEPGASALVQLVTEQPLACWHGDRFVVRDQSAQRTLAGGVVLDPAGWPRQRRSAVRLAMLTALEQPLLSQRLAGLLAQAPSGIVLEAWQQAFNQPLAAALADLPAVQQVQQRGQTLVFAAARWQELGDQLEQAVSQFHRDFPGELGPSSARLKRIACPALSIEAFDARLQALLEVGRLNRSGAWVHLPQHRIQLSAAEERLAAQLLPLLEAGRFDPPWVRTLAGETGQPEAQVRSLLLALTRQGLLYQVVKDLFFSAANIHALADLARQLETTHQTVRAADFRDATGLGRKRAIQILEFFDRVGYTRRVRDDHRLRGDSLFAIQ